MAAPFLLLKPPFTPRKLPGLRLWLAADRIVGLADGDPVASWTDLSGNGNHATQGTTAAKPLYKTGIVNGRPAVLFDGVDDFLSLPSGAYSVLSTSAKTVILAVKWVALGSDKRMLSTQNAGFSGRFSMVTFSSTAYQFFYQNGTTASNLFQVSGNAPSSSVPQICSFVQGGTVVNGYVNNTAIAAAGSDGGSEALINAALGANGAGSGAFGNLYILEALIYNRALSTAEASAVRRYLGARYGLAVA